MDGLDYYLVLDAAPDATQAALSDAYRRRRMLYPDDPRTLHPQLARQLGLLEESWRILGLPDRRAVYDRLRNARAQQSANQPALRSLSCVGCGGALGTASSFCPACGAAQSLPATSTPDLPIDQLPNYYDVLGIRPHYVPSPSAQRPARKRTSGGLLGLLTGLDDEITSAPVLTALSSDDLRLAYVTRQHELLLRNDPDADLALEVAYRVLSEPRRRAAYDSLMTELRERGWTEQRMRALSALDREVRAELSGGVSVDGTALLQQGQGLLKLNLSQQAVALLQQAAQALPDSAEAHYSYGMALWRSTDLMSFTGHQLRQGIAALTRAAQLDPRLEAVVAPYLGVWHGLAAYNQDDLAGAEHHFRATAARHPTFAAAWRMCAAAALRQQQYPIVLDACRRAMALDPTSEPVLLLAIAACWRQRQTDDAHDLAAQVARLRGDGKASAAGVLRELGLR